MLIGKASDFVLTNLRGRLAYVSVYDVDGRCLCMQCGNLDGVDHYLIDLEITSR